MPGLRGFPWRLCNYVGGDFAVKPNFKQFLVLDPNEFPVNGEWAGGIITMQPRDFSDVSVVTGFQPSLLMFVSYRPRNHNGATDTDFGKRGGGMSFGVAGLGTADDWDSGTNYDPGDRVMHEGIIYVSLSTHTNSEPPSADWTSDVSPEANFTGSTRFQQGFDLGMGIVSWHEDATLNVISALYGSGGVGIDILTLQATFNDNGFTLSVDENLYDQSDPIFWLAIGGGPIKVGVFDSGDTEVLGYPGTPGAAMFLSTKSKPSDDPYNLGYWNHMEGFASPDDQVSHWGGAIPTSWNWTTETWRDDESIVLGLGANNSFFGGAGIDQLGFVSQFKSGGIDLQWPIFDNIPYRIGYILFPDGEAGSLEANFTLRPEVVGTNFRPTRVRAHVIIMSTTNYNFNFDPDPLTFPRSADTFGAGGGGGFGWHIYPFGGNAWGVHSYANAVAELGHYANSATLVEIGCITNAAGASAQPPAAHQHGIYIPPNPVIVGINYRYGERHAQVKRFHRNPSDVYVPEPP